MFLRMVYVIFSFIANFIHHVTEHCTVIELHSREQCMASPQATSLLVEVSWLARLVVGLHSVVIHSNNISAWASGCKSAVVSYLSQSLAPACLVHSVETVGNHSWFPLLMTCTQLRQCVHITWYWPCLSIHWGCASYPVIISSICIKY